MDKTTLVSVDLDRGAQILRILDDAKLNVRVALWLYSPDYEDWRLVLSSPQFDAGDPVHAYGLVHDALEAAGVPLEKTPPIMILRMNSSFVRILRRIFGKAKSVEGMRLGGQTIGDRFVEDAYTYRVVWHWYSVRRDRARSGAESGRRECEDRAVDQDRGLDTRSRI